MVGIGYGDRPNERARDYLPTAADGQGGGFAAFSVWLTATLIPRLESEFPLAPGRMNRALGGHSFGGLAALYFLFDYSATFSALAATSPSLWWDGNLVFTDLAAFLSARPAVAVSAAEPPPVRLLLTVGSQEGGGMDVLHAELAARLVAASPANFELYSAVIAGKRHWNVRYAALTSGLAFLLGGAPAAGTEP